MSEKEKKIREDKYSWGKDQVTFIPPSENQKQKDQEKEKK